MAVHSSLSPAFHHEVVDWSGAAGGRGLTVLTSHQCYHLGNEHYTVMKNKFMLQDYTAAHYGIGQIMEGLVS